MSVACVGFDALADVLKMAPTRQKKELIKWLYARHIFFLGSAETLSAGFALARQCEHEDARFFVSLFPKGAPATVATAAVALLFHPGEDPRCSCWAGLLGSGECEKQLVSRAAAAGYAWAEYCWSDLVPQEESLLAREGAEQRRSQRHVFRRSAAVARPRSPTGQGAGRAVDVRGRAAGRSRRAVLCGILRVCRRDAGAGRVAASVGLAGAFGEFASSCE